jgi:hypothetical protein
MTTRTIPPTLTWLVLLALGSIRYVSGGDADAALAMAAALSVVLVWVLPRSSREP